MLKPTKSKKEMAKAVKKTAKSVDKHKSGMEALGRAVRANRGKPKPKDQENDKLKDIDLKERVRKN